MSVVLLTTEFPSCAWRRAFADALIRLRPELNPDAVDEVSDSAYMRLADLDPGNAAAIFSRDDGFPEAGASDGARDHAGP